MNLGTTVKGTWKVIRKFAEENAPTIVMGIGVGMMVGGTVTAVAATTKAVPKVADENARLKADGQRPLRKQEVVASCWKLYVPSILLTVGGASCVVAANHMNLTRIATLGAVAKMNEDKLKEYKEAARQALGEKDVKKIEQKRAENAVALHPPLDGPAYPGFQKSNMLCRDCMTGQYFWSSRSAIEAAVNKVNNMLSHGESVHLQTFLDEVGLVDEVGIGSMIGWDTDINGMAKHMLEMEYQFIEAPDGSPVLELNYEAYDLCPF